MWSNTRQKQPPAVGRFGWSHADTLPHLSPGLIAELATVAELAPGDPVYEISAGASNLTAALLRFGFNVTASDPQSQLRARLSEFDASRLQLREASFSQDRIAARSFAAVFAANRFPWLADHTLARIATTVGPDGALCPLWTFTFVEPLVQAKLNRSAFGPHHALVAEPGSRGNSIDNAMAASRRTIADSGLFHEPWWDCERSTRMLHPIAFAEMAASTVAASGWSPADRRALEEQIISDIDELGLATVTLTDHIYVMVARVKR